MPRALITRHPSVPGTLAGRRLLPSRAAVSQSGGGQNNNVNPGTLANGLLFAFDLNATGTQTSLLASPSGGTRTLTQVGTPSVVTGPAALGDALYSAVNGNAYTATSHADFSLGADRTFGFVVKLDTLAGSADKFLLSKTGGAGSIEYELSYNTTTGWKLGHTKDGGATISNAALNGSLFGLPRAAGRWMLVLMDYDHAALTLGLTVNGHRNTVSLTQAIPALGGTFGLLRNTRFNVGTDGAAVAAFWGWNRVLTATERQVLLNDAAFLAYPFDAEVFVDGQRTWYVGPSGGHTAAGTSGDPWSLTTGLEFGPDKTQVRPGDIVQIGAGTYAGAHTARLSGAAGQKVTFRCPQTHGQVVTLDQNTGSGAVGAALRVEGSYLRFLGYSLNWRVTNSYPDRWAPTPGSGPPVSEAGGRGIHSNPVYDFGNHNEFINLVVHDGSNGHASFTPAKHETVYGYKMMNNGWAATDRGHGHDFYATNADSDGSHKTVEHCALINGFTTGLKFGAETDLTQGLTLRDLAAFGAARWDLARAENTGDAGASNFLCGTADDIIGNTRNILIQRLMVGHPVGANQRGFGGIPLGSDETDNENVTLEDSVTVGGMLGLKARKFTDLVVRNNRVYVETVTGQTTFCGQIIAHAASAFPNGHPDWDENEYWDEGPHTSGNRYTFGYTRPDGTTYPNESGGGNLRYDHPTSTQDWRGTGVDANSTYTNGAKPNADWSYVWPNAWEQGSGIIVVYRWTAATAVSVALNQTVTDRNPFSPTYGQPRPMLAQGQAYAVVMADDLFGTPVLTGTYDSGSPNVNVPICSTNLGGSLPAFAADCVGRVESSLSQLPSMADYQYGMRVFVVRPN